jgi:RNA polymerase sigma-70 factor, ECF subfamily
MELTAIAGSSGASWEDVEAHGQELYGYCYRMLGSPLDADDAVQETMLRAWRASGRFAGRSSLRVWLHRIATNVCLDMLRQRSRRERPIDLIPVGIAGSPLGEPGSSISWVLPAPDRRLVPERADPADVAVLRDTVRLAFIAALQHLIAQRARRTHSLRRTALAGQGGGGSSRNRVSLCEAEKTYVVGKPDLGN